MATIGSGTTLHVNDGTSSAYVVVTDAFEVSLPWSEQEVVEATNLDSGGVKQFILGLTNPGTGSFKCRYTESALDRMLTLKDSALAHSFKETMIGSSTYIVSCYVTKVECGAVTPDAVTEFTVSLQATAKGVFTIV